jgi:hypothetical protein
VSKGDAMNLTVIAAATEKVAVTMPFPGDPEAGSFGCSYAAQRDLGG